MVRGSVLQSACLATLSQRAVCSFGTCYALTLDRLNSVPRLSFTNSAINIWKVINITQYMAIGLMHN